jgi:hypothetical protein
MNKQSATRLAWLLWALSVVIVGVDLFVGYLNQPSIGFADFFDVLVILAFPTVGALIISRRPENLIGWLLAGGMFLNLLGNLALDYSVYTLLTAPHALPGGEWMLFVGGAVRSLGFFGLIAFLPLLFPDGKPPTPRWRPVGWFGVAAAAFTALATAFAPFNDFELRLPELPNPLGFSIPPDIYQAVSGIGPLGMGIVTVLAAVSLIVRYRHAQGEVRLQLKWFALAGVLAAVIFGYLLGGMMFLPPDAAGLSGSLFYLALVGFPIAVGIAILKYRLYEIDLIIRRTLIYTLLTVLLVVVYLGSVSILEQLLAVLNGQRQPEIVIVISTLAIAALFVPLRRRVQDSIDRRFYRRKYDAQQVLARFGQTARDETDLGALMNELAGVIYEAMQPATVSVWLRTSSSPLPGKERNGEAREGMR